MQFHWMHGEVLTQLCWFFWLSVLWRFNVGLFECSPLPPLNRMNNEPLGVEEGENVCATAKFYVFVRTHTHWKRKTKDYEFSRKFVCIRTLKLTWVRKRKCCVYTVWIPEMSVIRDVFRAYQVSCSWKHFPLAFVAEFEWWFRVLRLWVA